MPANDGSLASVLVQQGYTLSADWVYETNFAGAVIPESQ